MDIFKPLLLRPNFSYKMLNNNPNDLWLMFELTGFAIFIKHFFIFQLLFVLVVVCTRCSLSAAESDVRHKRQRNQGPDFSACKKDIETGQYFLFHFMALKASNINLYNNMICQTWFKRSVRDQQGLVITGLICVLNGHLAVNIFLFPVTEFCWAAYNISSLSRIEDLLFECIPKISVRYNQVSLYIIL